MYRKGGARERLECPAQVPRAPPGSLHPSGAGGLPEEQEGGAVSDVSARRTPPGLCLHKQARTPRLGVPRGILRVRP